VLTVRILVTTVSSRMKVLGAGAGQLSDRQRVSAEPAVLWAQQLATTARFPLRAALRRASQQGERSNRHSGASKCRTRRRSARGQFTQPQRRGSVIADLTGLNQIKFGAGWRFSSTRAALVSSQRF